MNATTNTDNNTDHNEYANQAIYNTIFSPPNDQFSQSLSSDHGTQKSWILLHSQKSSNSWTKQDLNSQKRVSRAPRPTHIHKVSTMSMVWSISTGQLGLAAWLCSLPAPAHPLVSWTWETGRSPWFPIKNWKHQCYQHSTKSKTQQLQRGKL